MEYTVTQVGAVSGGEAYLLDDGHTAFLFDSGFAFCGSETAENVRRQLGTRPLQAILLSHSHYDHAGGAPYVQVLYPQATVYAHAYAQQVFQKEGAKRVMRDMDRTEAERKGYAPYPDRFDQLHADVPVTDGDTLSLGDWEFTVLSLPGHTRCSVGYWCAAEKLLLCSETLGVMGGNGIVTPTYLVGYQMTLDALARGEALKAEHLLIPHYGMLSGAEHCQAFFRTARYWAEETYRRVHAAHDAGQTEEACIALLRTLFYTPETAKIQPIKAFELNASYMVPMLLRA